MKPPILLIDNYDSFTYNLHHLLCQYVDAQKIVVKKNDQIDMNELAHFDKIMISPGPGIPDEAGDTKKIIELCKSNKDILGVCLGLQAIAEVFGGKLRNLSQVYHGVSTHVEIVSQDALFHQMPKVFEAGRYHSWVMDNSLIPEQVEILAKDEKNEIMAIRIKHLKIRGVQFHPESVLTPLGKQIIYNWLML